jgi:hypothetical protein
MHNTDPRTDPNTAPLIVDDVKQPYARRSIMAIFWGAVIVIAVAFFSGWFYSQEEGGQEIKTVSEGSMSVPQPPVERVERADSDDVVYDFFYAMFSGIKDGAEDSPHNLDNVGHLDNLDLDGGSAGPLVMPDVEPARSQRESFESMFDGKILDYQGRVAGDIAAMRYDDGEIQNFIFILKETLTPEDETRRYTVPEDEVKVVQDGDMFFVQLNKEQTDALAAELYDGPKE